MSDWMIWFMFAGLLVILEMATGTFYLLMLGIGLGAGGLAALAGASMQWQILVAAVVGSFVMLVLRKSRFGKLGKTEAARDPNVNLDVGERIAIQEWSSIADGSCTARTRYRGADWDVELAPGSVARAGAFVIREVRGNRLIVANNGSESQTTDSQ